MFKWQRREQGGVTSAPGQHQAATLQQHALKVDTPRAMPRPFCSWAVSVQAPRSIVSGVKVELLVPSLSVIVSSLVTKQQQQRVVCLSCVALSSAHSQHSPGVV